MKYDIFISYRRELGFDSANLIATKLRVAGYRVFFDLESMRSGKFNEQLYNVIEQCKDVIVVLPENALDRCCNADDWLRLEVTRAIQLKKNIIPVMLKGFQWPAEMPEGMEDLNMYQAITASSHEYYDQSIERMISYLKSNPSAKKKHWVKVLGITTAAMVLLFAICAYAVYLISVPPCMDVVCKMTGHMGLADMIGAVNKNVDATWKNYVEAWKYNGWSKERSDDLIEKMNLFDKEISGYEAKSKQFSIHVEGFKAWLIGLYDVPEAEVNMNDDMFQQMYDDIHQDISDFITVASDSLFDINDVNGFTVKPQIIQHYINALAYSYLDILSKLPEKTWYLYYQQSEDWNYVPNGIGLNRTSQEYEQFLMQEMNQIGLLFREGESHD